MFVRVNPVAGPATALVFSLAAAFVATPAAAQQCVDRGQLAAQLGSEYAESQTAVGLANNGTLIEVFTSAEGTWTILTTTPSGESCAIAAGERWSEPESPEVARLEHRF